MDEPQVLSVLVIEDEALVAMMLRRSINDAGHRTRAVAANLRDAKRWIKTRSAEFDVALLDANLGGVPATPIAEILAAAGIPFLMVTGYSEAEIRALGIDAPTLRKPFRTSTITKALRELTRR